MSEIISRTQRAQNTLRDVAVERKHTGYSLREAEQLQDAARLETEAAELTKPLPAKARNGKVIPFGNDSNPAWEIVNTRRDPD